MSHRLPHSWWLIIPTVLLLVACGARRTGSHRQPGGEAPTGLPSDLPSLLSAAESAYDPSGPAESVARSLSAARRALDIRPDDEAANHCAARAALWLLEFDERLGAEEARKLAGDGAAWAQAALAAGGERVEYVFHAGSLLGYQLKLSRAPGLARLRRVHELFRRAVALDPSFDDGAPLRALGTLLVKAPPWPGGVGDPEEGTALLEQAAARFPGHPANHYYLAEALAAEGRQEAAREHWEEVLDLCGDPRWGARCAKYAALARHALGEEGSTADGVQPSAAAPR